MSRSSSQSPICVLAIGCFQRGQFDRLGLRDLLGDLLLDADQHAQRLGVNLPSASIASLCRIPPTFSRRSATARAVAAAGLFSWWVSPA